MMNYYKQKLLFLSLISVSIVIQAMDTGTTNTGNSGQIIKNPAWSQRRIYLCNKIPDVAFRGLFFGLFPRTIQNSEPETQKYTYLKSFWYAAVSLTRHALILQLKQKELLDWLLTNPQMILTILNGIHSFFWAELRAYGAPIATNVQDCKPDLKRERAVFKKHFENYVKICPLFHLGVAYQQPQRPQLYPLYGDFHKKIETLFLHKIGDINKPISSVIDSCEDFFSNILILAHVLTKKPNAYIVTHILNQKHKEYCIVKDLVQTSPPVTRALEPKNRIDLTPHLPVIQDYIKDNGLNCSPSVIEYQFGETELFYNPLLTFLRNSFPHASLAWFLHYDHEDYWNYQKKHSLPAADIIYTTHEKFMNRAKGIPDSPTFQVYPCYDQEIFGMQTLQENPEAEVVFLSYNDLDLGKASLFCRLCACPTEKTIRIDVPTRTSGYYYAEQWPCIPQRLKSKCDSKKTTLFLEIESIDS